MKREQKEYLQQLAAKHGTPLFVIDHDIIRQNYREFVEKLPDVQVFFAIKSNSNPEILKTLFDLGSGFDVASVQEFRMVYKNFRHLPEKKRQDFIWDKMIYANTIKPAEDIKNLSRIMVTFDNIEELKKIKAVNPKLGLILRLRVPNTGSLVELSSKFGADPGEAVDLMIEAIKLGLEVGGISFHVGSQCNNFENYIQAFNLAHSVFKEAKLRGLDLGFNVKDGKKTKVLDIGGGFPVKYTQEDKSFGALGRKLNSELKRLFGKDENLKIIAEPGRFMVATACTLVTKIIGKSVRDEKTCYYLDDGVYHTFSGQIYDHQHYPLHSFKEGEKKIVSTFGPTCDAFDTISLADELPDNLQIDDLLYAENIGAYTFASATYFNGFKPPKVVHINREQPKVSAPTAVIVDAQKAIQKEPEKVAVHAPAVNGKTK
ncbi:MAG: type III PLP-dependent enzyme [Candidatus Doudnabacteria bacterium]|nr:type III PLP-dependent enzyme [Candidatus Doudnabacteria bacterium]